MILFLEGILWLFRFTLGACIFSFLHVIACRLPKGESAVRGRSHCPHCGKTLTVWELIPCVSYLAQGGKCRGCKALIPKRYFLAECTGGLALVCCCARFGFGTWGLISLRGLLAFAYLGLLLLIALMDWDTQIIRDRFQVCIGLLGIAALWLFPEHALADRLIGTIAGSLPMLILALLVEGAFGGGDIKLMAVSGFFLGWKSIVAAMFLGLLLGGTLALWLMARKKLNRRDHMAFGPFLALGLTAALFYGDQMVSWYLSIL